jgi:hypothetical protein
MNKFKVWLRNKLKIFLEIDKLENNYKDYKLANENNIWNLNNDIRMINKRISNNTYAIDTLHATIENVVHIGTDIRRDYNGNSWAVICIEGKMNVVKFVDLNGKDIREVLHFLKQFEAGRHCIDTPYREMFYDGLFKF